MIPVEYGLFDSKKNLLMCKSLTTHGVPYFTLYNNDNVKIVVLWVLGNGVGWQFREVVQGNQTDWDLI